MFVAIVKTTPAGRFEKGKIYPTEAEALAHVERVIGANPDAYVAEVPVESNAYTEWLCDPVAKTVTFDPLPVVKPTVISYEDFQDRFTATEFNAATDFVYESDLTTGKPKRRAFIQGLGRAMAKGTVDLNDARTVAFMDALVTGGVVTSDRKTVILTP